LKGALSGTVAKLNLKKFELGFGTKSVLRGDFGFKGLPDVDKTDMDFMMRSSLFLSPRFRYLHHEVCGRKHGYSRPCGF